MSANDIDALLQRLALPEVGRREILQGLALLEEACYAGGTGASEGMPALAAALVQLEKQL